LKPGIIEKRQQERIPVSLKARYLLLTDENVRGYRSNPDFVKPIETVPGKAPTAQMKDLSEGGMALVGSDLFRAGYKVLVSFEIPEPAAEISSVTEVMWVQQFMEGGRPMYRAGLRFMLMRKYDVEKMKAFLSSQPHPKI